jgi:predicted dehydrogenase
LDTINIGVIGCGAMGMGVVRQLLACDKRLRVTAVHDPDTRSVEKAKDELGTGLAVCSDYHDILGMRDVQWVMIASWNCHHAEQVVAAFQADKHVFCQKPLALSVAECRAMRQAWEQGGKMFNIGFTLRYSPHYRRIKQLVSEGKIGQIISMEFNETLDFNHGGYIMGDWRRQRKNAGTHLLEKCSHDIDLVNWIVGTRAKRVASFGGLDFFLPRNKQRTNDIPARADGKKAYRTWGGLINLDPFTSDKDIVDNQVAIIEYDGGVRATFHTNCNAAIPERRMYILGTSGAIRADVLTGTIQMKQIGFDTTVEDLSTEGKGGHGGGDKVLADELADSMLRQKLPSVGLMEGLESAVTCFAIDEAMDTGTVVNVQRYWAEIEMAEPSVPGDA